MVTRIPLASLRAILAILSWRAAPPPPNLIPEKELIQLATLLSGQLEQHLRRHRPDSPETIGHTLSIADELISSIEYAFDEARCLEEIAAEAERNRRRIALRYFGKVCP